MTGTAVYGLEAPELSAGYIPVEATVVIKCLDADGETVLVTRSTATLPIWDRIGMLTCALDIARRDVQRGFVADEDAE